jgi:hypothetical protein
MSSELHHQFEARFGEPRFKDGSAKGWTLSKTRFLAYYYNEGMVWRFDVSIADRRPS